MSVKFNFNTLDKGFQCAWPVLVPVPQDGGKVETQEFTAIFRSLTPAEDEAAKNASTDETPWAWLDARFVGLVDAELTPELRDQLMRTPYVRNAIINALSNFNQGIPAKN